MNYPVRITKVYIKDTYNLNDERKKVPSLKLIDDLENAMDLDANQEYSIIEFYSIFEKVMKELGVDVVKFTYGGEYNLYEKVDRLETNDEVVDRIQKALVNQRKGEELKIKERAEYERLKAIFEGE